MRTKSTHPTGFSFVESLITLSIVGVFLMLIWGTIQFLILQSAQKIARNQAHFLAVEGVEIIKQIKQTAVNQNAEHGFQDYFNQKSGDFIIQKNHDRFELIEGESELISSNTEPFIDYCRTLSITPETHALVRVSSIVQWGGADCQDASKHIAYSTYLSDLKK